jgi:hypothetical protein
MIFLSYSWMDAQFVRILELRLLDSGIKFWVDYQRITPILPIEQQNQVRYSSSAVIIE